jgi:hypothetical protein
LTQVTNLEGPPAVGVALGRKQIDRFGTRWSGVTPARRK